MGFQSNTSQRLTSSSMLILTLPALCWMGTSRTEAFAHNTVSTSTFSTGRFASASSTSALHGIQEWRDEAQAWDSYDEEHDVDDDDDQIVGSVPIHLMDSSKVALQGEKVYLQFTKDDEVKLFQQAIDCHHGVFGLGFCTTRPTLEGSLVEESEEEVLYDTISLAEIQDFNLMGDDFGIFFVAQVVGRAMILQTNANEEDAPLGLGSELAPEEPIMAVCSEIPNREEIVSLEDASKMGRMVQELIVDVSQAEVQELQEEEDGDESRFDRYWEAYQQALAVGRPNHLDSTSNEETTLLSWEELDAISWAAFSTNEHLTHDETYRLAALDNDCLTNRLRLATFWLSDILQDAKQASS